MFSRLIFIVIVLGTVFSGCSSGGNAQTQRCAKPVGSFSFQPELFRESVWGPRAISSVYAAHMPHNSLPVHLWQTDISLRDTVASSENEYPDAHRALTEIDQGALKVYDDMLEAPVSSDPWGDWREWLDETKTTVERLRRDLESTSLLVVESGVASESFFMSILPSGDILVSKQALRRLRSAGLLEFAIAHERAHVLLNHHVRMQNRPVVAYRRGGEEIGPPAAGRVLLGEPGYFGNEGLKKDDKSGDGSLLLLGQILDAFSGSSASDPCEGALDIIADAGLEHPDLRVRFFGTLGKVAVTMLNEAFYGLHSTNIFQLIRRGHASLFNNNDELVADLVAVDVLWNSTYGLEKITAFLCADFVEEGHAELGERQAHIREYVRRVYSGFAQVLTCPAWQDVASDQIEVSQPTQEAMLHHPWGRQTFRCGGDVLVSVLCEQRSDRQ